MEHLVNKDSPLIGKRLDEALFSLGAASSRSKAQKLLKEGSVKVNGKIEKAHYALEENDLISYQDYVEPSTKLTPEDIPLDIIYEDKDILIINKPAGLSVHPGSGHQGGTLVNGLVYHIKSLANPDDPIRPGLVHRIDKDTSGLLAIAKTEEAFASLSKQLSDHSMHREYLALVKGIIYEGDGKIDAPIARSKRNPLANAVDLVDGKEAVTYFHVLKRYKADDVTLVSCRLLTGRTHQIRVHMDYICHPIIGDPIYGEGNKKIYKNGQLLHAFRLSFVHPVSGKEVSFYAPVPTYFRDFIMNLK